MIKRAHEEHAEAQREYHGARLISRPIQTCDSLAKRERPRRAQNPSRKPREERRAEVEHRDRAADRNGEADAALNRVRSCQPEVEHAEHDRERQRDAKRVPTRATQRIRVRLPTQRLQRRHAAQRDERAQRKEKRDPNADGQAEEHGLRLELHVDVDGQEVREHSREQELNSYAEDDARRRADEAHDRGLRGVDCQHLRARRADAAENRDRIDLLQRECVHPARHADAAEQERNQPHDREIVVQLIDRAGET